MTILLPEIWPINNPIDYKIHFARSNGSHHPLDVWTRSLDEWQTWQEYRPQRNEFNRPLIFSLIQFYHEQDIWLFGGIFKVTARHADRYEVEPAPIAQNFNGRLKLRSSYRERATRLDFENHYSHLEVQEILREPYSGRAFPGYEDIDISFDELLNLVHNNRPDWKAALESVKGIYLITDISTGKRYVGSAYSEHGIWSRWCAYAQSGHGGNIQLQELLLKTKLDYCRANFRFALLEHRPVRTADSIVIDRETFWKRTLLTRGDHGLNSN